MLSGSPTASGNFSFIVQATDAASTATTKALTISVAAANVIHHFNWDFVPATANAGSRFAARITARNSDGMLVSNYGATANLSATSGPGLPTPVLITEVTPASENQIELQNVSGTSANTSGWFIRIGDSTTNSVAGMNALNATTYSLPASLAAGQILRITESSSNTSGGRVYFGGAIGWANTPGNRRGWVALFDGTNTLRDFFAFGWTATDIASFAITVNGQGIALGSQWTGAGTASSGSVAGQTYDSFQRTGTNDNNSTADWAWKHNADNTDATSLGATNTSLTIPWASATPLTVAPTSVTFSNGEFIGYVTIATAATDVLLTADDGASHAGVSVAFAVGAAIASTADGIPDSWKTAHGFSASANIASLDTDGDGMTNLDEYQAGTDPQSSVSRFSITSATTPATNQLAITCPGVAGKIYRISTSFDLAVYAAWRRACHCGWLTIPLDQPGDATRRCAR